MWVGLGESSPAKSAGYQLSNALPLHAAIGEVQLLHA